MKFDFQLGKKALQTKVFGGRAALAHGKLTFVSSENNQTPNLENLDDINNETDHLE